MTGLVTYVLSGCAGTPVQHVMESRARVATLDEDEVWWRLRYKSKAARARVFSDWEYEELRLATFGVRSEADAVRWVTGGRIR